MSKQFSGKVVLITGGATGIGRATAVEFANEGAIVAISDIKDNGGEQTSDILKKMNAEVMYTKVDVTQKVQVEEWINSIVAKYGRIDYCINNAGIAGTDAKTHEYDEEMFDKVFEINVKALWQCMRFEIPVLLKQQKGVIINIASVAGLGAFKGKVAYSASKHAVIGMTKTTAVEYATKGIRVNAVCPSFIETPMVTEMTKDNQEAFDNLARINPMKRVGRAEEVAKGIMFLCSDAASYINGHSLVIDGGLSA